MNDFIVDLIERVPDECVRIEANGLRGYKVGNTIYPSITSVLGAKDAAKYKNFPAHIARAAANRGTIYHSLVENFLLGAPLPAGNRTDQSRNDANACFRGSVDWLTENIEVVRAIELPVFSTRHKIAGTMDLLARTKNHGLAVIDHKTSSRPKKLVEMESYLFQLAFYGDAVAEMTGETPDSVIISLATPLDGHYPFVVEFNRLSDYANDLGRLRAFYMRSLYEK